MDNGFIIEGECFFFKLFMEVDVMEGYLNGFSDDEVMVYLEVNGKELMWEVVVDYIENGKKIGSYFMFVVYLKDL